MTPEVYAKLPVKQPGRRKVSLSEWIDLWRTLTIEQQNDERFCRRINGVTWDQEIFINGEWIY